MIGWLYVDYSLLESSVTLHYVHRTVAVFRLVLTSHDSINRRLIVVTETARFFVKRNRIFNHSSDDFEIRQVNTGTATSY